MRRFKNILVFVPPESEYKGAVTRAADLAKRNQARVTLMTCVEPLPRWSQALLPEGGRKWPEMAEKEARDQVENLAAELGDHGIPVTTVFKTGQVHIEVIRQVIREGHDLLLKGAEAIGSPEQPTSSPLDLRLLRKCPCPVWLLRPTEGETFTKVLAAVDPEPGDYVRSALNTKIMDLSSSLVELEGGELHVVHAWSAYGDTLLERRLGEQDYLHYKKAVEEEVRTAFEELVGPYRTEQCPLTAHLKPGKPEDVVPGIIEKEGIELVVMGTVARTGIAGFLIGNTAERMLKHVTCSILALKPDGFISPVSLGE